MGRATMRAKALGATLAVASALGVGSARAEVGFEGFDALAGIEAGQVPPDLMSLPELEAVQGRFYFDASNVLRDSADTPYSYVQYGNERFDVYTTPANYYAWYDKYYGVVWINATTYVDADLNLRDLNGAWYANYKGDYYGPNNNPNPMVTGYLGNWNWYGAWIVPGAVLAEVF